LSSIFFIPLRLFAFVAPVLLSPFYFLTTMTIFGGIDSFFEAPLVEAAFAKVDEDDVLSSLKRSFFGFKIVEGVGAYCVLAICFGVGFAMALGPFFCLACGTDLGWRICCEGAAKYFDFINLCFDDSFFYFFVTTVSTSLSMFYLGFKGWPFLKVWSRVL
jgi:hypothetical protein